MLPLYENLKLRTSEELGDFTDVFVLPHRYGDLRQSAVKLQKISNTQYFYADHVTGGVTSVSVSGKKITAWEANILTDTNGVNYTVVNLATVTDRDNAVVTAAGFGKLHPTTGNLLDNPADIIEDLGKINGRIVQYPVFKDSCSLKGIFFAGSAAEVKSLRLYTKEIALSAGAVVVDNDIRFFLEPLSYYEELFDYYNPSFTVSSENQFGKVKLGYNYNEGSSKYDSFIIIKALNSPYTAEQEIYSRWIRSNSFASKLASDYCKRASGIQAEVTSTVAGDISVGSGVILQNSLFPQPFLVTESQKFPTESQIKGNISVNLWESIELVSLTVNVAITSTDSIELSFDRGTLTITIFDTDNKPFVGAFVSLDNSSEKKTNSKGKVQFKTKAGAHVLSISAPGYDSINNLPIQVQ